MPVQNDIDEWEILQPPRTPHCWAFDSGDKTAIRGVIVRVGRLFAE